jgi:hypothetical protein
VDDTTWHHRLQTQARLISVEKIGTVKKISFFSIFPLCTFFCLWPFLSFPSRKTKAKKFFTIAQKTARVCNKKNSKKSRVNSKSEKKKSETKNQKSKAKKNEQYTWH